MAQTGFTPIQIYSSSTASAAPVAGSLTNSTLGSELAINITDGKLFYKDNANAIQVIGWKVVPTTAGGTGLTSYTAGDLLFYASGAALSKLAIGASATVLTSSGSAPQWTAQSGLSVGSATNLVGGAQGSIPYQNGVGTTVFLAKNTTATRYLANTGASNNPDWAQINLANGVTGTLPVGNGGTGAASWTANGVIYASGTTTLAQATNFVFTGTNLAVGQATSTARITSQTSQFGDATISSNCAFYGKAFGGTATSTRTIEVLHVYTNDNSAHADIQIGFVQSNNSNTRGGAVVYTAGQGLSFRTGATSISADTLIGTERVLIASGGATYFPGVGTTASAANAFLDSGSTPANQLLRSTSSIKYKTDVEPIQPQYSDAVLNLTPVWYRSKAERDRKDWSWYGLIAEEVAKIDPRLVHYGYSQDDYEEVEVDAEIQTDNGIVLGKEQKMVLKADAVPQPDGVQYERIAVLLLDVVKKQEQRIKNLESALLAGNE
jgi:hypothetical protein